MHAFVDDLAGGCRRAAGRNRTQRASRTASAVRSAASSPPWQKRAGRRLFERIAMLDPPIHPDDCADARNWIRAAASSIRGRSIAAQARKRNAVWPSRASARAAWQDKPMFKAWQPRAFDLYLDEGFRDRPDGQRRTQVSTRRGGDDLRDQRRSRHLRGRAAASRRRFYWCAPDADRCRRRHSNTCAVYCLDARCSYRTSVICCRSRRRS